jgi:A/G-specific adenine glycosylase
MFTILNVRRSTFLNSKGELAELPTIKTLAESSEEDVLLIWQGLGYYSRARNLHKAARQIMQDHNGEFPETFDQIRKLKGVGDYTASAIASISFGLPYAVVDGNVYRVLSRISGTTTPIATANGKKEFALLASSFLDKENPGLYNEAIMEFGALQCRPSNPLCSECPFITECYAFKNGQIGSLPVRAKKISQRNRYFNYLLIRYDQQFYLQKRAGKDIWKNLYQLPLIETATEMDEKKFLLSPSLREIFRGHKPSIKSVSRTITHQLSHQKLFIRFIDVHVNEPLSDNGYILISPEQMPDFPFPKPINNYLAGELAKTI